MFLNKAPAFLFLKTNKRTNHQTNRAIVRNKKEISYFYGMDKLVIICSPAKAIEESHIKEAEGFFEKQGYKTERAKHLLGQNNYFSGTIEERAADFQNAIDHPDAVIILCARGGYGCLQLMPHLDWTNFIKKPKILIGFSDITVFHQFLASKGLPSLHATMPLNYKDNSDLSFSSMMDAIEERPYSLVAPNSKYNQKGKVTADVIGGNLSVLSGLLALHPKNIFDDKILFIEDLGEHLYHYDRMLQVFTQSHSFERLAGVVVGSFTNSKDTEVPYGKTLEEIVLSHFSSLNIPIGFGFPAGHAGDNQAIIFGMPADLIVDDSAELKFYSELAP
ncbi:MAG: muramoyltetrapeptide carboxypeptidase [Lentimonas sp.]